MTRWEKVAAVLLLAAGVVVSVYAYSRLKLGMVISPDAGFLPFFLGIALSILAAVWLVKDGPGSAAGAVRFFPEGRWQKLLLVLVVVHVAALLFDAPLEEIADATRTPNPAKAPWYFLGLQELVHYSALVGGVLVPGLVVIALLLAPYLDPQPRGGGVSLSPERRWARGSR